MFERKPTDDEILAAYRTFYHKANRASFISRFAGYMAATGVAMMTVGFFGAPWWWAGVMVLLYGIPEALNHTLQVRASRVETLYNMTKAQALNHGKFKDFTERVTKTPLPEALPPEHPYTSTDLEDEDTA